MTHLYDSLIDIMKLRHSCRAYDTDRAVPAQVMDCVLEAARIAPSACNRQPWEFVVMQGPEARALVQSVYDRSWIATAPAFIVAVGLHADAWHRPSDGKDHTDVDVSIATEHICLAAAALGLGTCWVCNFDKDTLCAAMELDPDREPVAIIPIGYPAPDREPKRTPRKSLEEISKCV